MNRLDITSSETRTVVFIDYKIKETLHLVYTITGHLKLEPLRQEWTLLKTWLNLPSEGGFNLSAFQLNQHQPCTSSYLLT
jgi:hypothetical protein